MLMTQGLPVSGNDDEEGSHGWLKFFPPSFRSCKREGGKAAEGDKNSFEEMEMEMDMFRLIWQLSRKIA